MWLTHIHTVKVWTHGPWRLNFCVTLVRKMIVCLCVFERKWAIFYRKVFLGFVGLSCSTSERVTLQWNISPSYSYRRFTRLKEIFRNVVSCMVKIKTLLIKPLISFFSRFSHNCINSVDTDEVYGHASGIVWLCSVNKLRCYVYHFHCLILAF